MTTTCYFVFNSFHGYDGYLPSLIANAEKSGHPLSTVRYWDSRKESCIDQWKWNFEVVSTRFLPDDFVCIVMDAWSVVLQASPQEMITRISSCYPTVVQGQAVLLPSVPPGYWNEWLCTGSTGTSPRHLFLPKIVFGKASKLQDIARVFHSSYHSSSPPLLSHPFHDDDDFLLFHKRLIPFHEDWFQPDHYHLFECTQSTSFLLFDMVWPYLTEQTMMSSSYRRNSHTRKIERKKSSSSTRHDRSPQQDHDHPLLFFAPFGGNLNPFAFALGYSLRFPYNLHFHRIMVSPRLQRRIQHDYSLDTIHLWLIIFHGTVLVVLSLLVLFSPSAFWVILASLVYLVIIFTWIQFDYCIMTPVEMIFIPDEIAYRCHSSLRRNRTESRHMSKEWERFVHHLTQYRVIILLSIFLVSYLRVYRLGRKRNRSSLPSHKTNPPDSK